MGGWKAVLCFLVKSEKTRRGPVKGRPFSQGLWEEACLMPPVHTPFYVGQVWDVTVLLLGAPPRSLPAAWDLLPPPLPTLH